MPQTATYDFTDQNGNPDEISITASYMPKSIPGGTFAGEGYAVTSIGGSLDGVPITGEIGNPGSVQLAPDYGFTFDNALFLDPGAGGEVGTHSGNLDGIDWYGVEFAAGGIDYNLFSSDGEFILGDTNSSETLTLVSYEAPCFCAGTQIATPDGQTNVEALNAGDLVLTAEGEAVPVRWVGVRAVSRRFSAPLRVLPIRITAGALGGGLPRRDLLVSPDHAMFVGGLLVQASALVNGGSIRRETGMAESFSYYHIETPAHSLILAEGAPTETFIDNAERMAFDNWAEYTALPPRVGPFGELPYARVKSARQLPLAIRSLLQGAAAAQAA
jgi:hypothetical protein